jgi:hypothetical protein
MQALGRRGNSIHIKAEGGAVGGKTSFTHTLDFYRDVPSFEMQIDEFEDYALGRLKVKKDGTNC